jgi:hypothetical protein
MSEIEVYTGRYEAAEVRARSPLKGVGYFRSGLL